MYTTYYLNLLYATSVSGPRPCVCTNCRFVSTILLLSSSGFSLLLFTYFSDLHVCIVKLGHTSVDAHHLSLVQVCLPVLVGHTLLPTCVQYAVLKVSLAPLDFFLDLLYCMVLVHASHSLVKRLVHCLELDLRELDLLRISFLRHHRILQ